MEKDTRRVPRIALVAAVVVVALAALWFFAENALVAEKTDPKAEGDSSVVATVAGQSITRAELEEALASDLKRLERERHQLMEQGLENLITEKLLEVEAEGRGLSLEELVQAEVEDKITEVSDEQIDEFYESRRAQIGQPKDQVVSQIRQYLSGQQRQQAQIDLVQRLREKHVVESFLQPMRITVGAVESPSKGPEGAPVQIVEFSDFQCPFCSRVVPTLNRITETYGDKVRLVFRQFPLNGIHPQAQKAAEASLCAHDQGKFWEMHDAMFADQGALAVDKLKETAGGLGLDGEAFAECLDSGRYADRVDEDLQAGIEAGVTGTPAIFVNGRFLSGAQPYDAIAKIIDDELSRQEG